MTSRIRYATVKAAIFVALNCTPAVIWAQAPLGTDTISASAPQSPHWKEIKIGRHMTVRVDPGANWSQYGSVAVGSVDYTGLARSLTPGQSAKLVSLFHASLVKELSAVSASPNPSADSTLLLNASITKVKRSHPIINVVTIAAVFVPLDLGDANVTARLVDRKTGRTVAEIDAAGCGQIYQVLPSLEPLGQSKIVLKKESHSLAREVARISNKWQSAGL